MSERDPVIFQPVNPTKPASSDLTNIVVYSIVSVLVLTVVFYVCAYAIKVNTERRIMRERSALWRNQLRRPQVHVINPAEIMRNFPVRIYRVAPKAHTQDMTKQIDLSEVVVEQPGSLPEKTTERVDSQYGSADAGEEDENLCAICLEEYNEGECLRELPCHHFFHVAVSRLFVSALIIGSSNIFSASIPGFSESLQHVQCAKPITWTTSVQFLSPPPSDHPLAPTIQAIAAKDATGIRDQDQHEDETDADLFSLQSRYRPISVQCDQDFLEEPAIKIRDKQSEARHGLESTQFKSFFVNCEYTVRLG